MTLELLHVIRDYNIHLQGHQFQIMQVISVYLGLTMTTDQLFRPLFCQSVGGSNKSDNFSLKQLVSMYFGLAIKYNSILRPLFIILQDGLINDSLYHLLDSLVVESWHRVLEVPGSIPSQGLRHTKDVIKMVPGCSLVQHSTLKREILALSQELRQKNKCNG